ncbi:MAG: ferrous iron transporter B [Fuerstiella sp.]
MADTRTKAATVVLVGNPNAGKTSLFNRLTGLRARTANYPGITVDLRKGPLNLNGQTAELIDLPGLYSIDALSPEEQVAKAVLLGDLTGESVPDAVVLVLDATNLERNLFLASQVLDLELPTVVALNLIDAARAADIRIEVERLAEELHCPVIPVSAKTGQGTEELKRRVQEKLSGGLPILEQSRQSCTTGCMGCHFAARYEWAERISKSTVHTPETHGRGMARADSILTHPAWGVVAFLSLMLGVFYLIFSLASVPMDLVDESFARLGELAGQAVPSGAVNRIIWFPVVFGLSLGTFAIAYPTARVRWTWRSGFVAVLTSVLVALLPTQDFRSLLVDGVIGGIGGVLIFLPQICILFFLISLLEDSGYMARAAFVMERLMRFVGLPGKAFVPMLSAHACAIPGIMAARVIENWRDRLVTILVLPLLTCSARLPVYSMIAALLFADNPFNAALVFVGAYMLGIGAALFSAWCLKKTILKGEAIPLVIELPAYRMPVLRNALITVFERGTIFVRQAGTVILLISVILWALATYPKLPPQRIAELQNAPAVAAQKTAEDASDRNMASEEAANLPTAPAGDAGDGRDVDEIEQRIAQEALAYSVAGRVGRFVEPVFRPLGFDWKINVGVLTSFAAREVVVSTLAIVYGIGESGAEDESTLVETLRRQKRPDGSPVFSVATSLSLLVFFVLAMQCLPTQAVTRRETGSWKWAALQLGYMSGLAYVAAMFTYQVCAASGLG